MGGLAVTTIIYDGKYLVADGRTNAGGMIITDNAKKIIDLDSKFRFSSYFRDLTEEDSLVCIAVCGDCDADALYLDYLYKNDKFEEMEATALLFTKGHIYRSDGHKFYEVNDEPVAIGSGSRYALTALRMGKSAKKAIEIACQMDCYSGGQITVRKVR
jgi:20S proteasome alpha/beta subunit